MSQQYDNTNRGVLFDNERREKDSHPDMTGTLNVNGVEHWFSGWWKTGKNDSKFLSLSLGKPKEQRGAIPASQSMPERRGSRPSQSAPQQRTPTMAGPAASVRSSGFDDMDDDFPFITSAFDCDMTTSKQRRMARYDF